MSEHLDNEDLISTAEFSLPITSEDEEFDFDLPVKTIYNVKF